MVAELRAHGARHLADRHVRIKADLVELPDHLPGLEGPERPAALGARAGRVLRRCLGEGQPLRDLAHDAVALVQGLDEDVARLRGHASRSKAQR